MTRTRLGVLTFGLLPGLVVLERLVTVHGVLALAVFAVAVVLVGVWFFRFAPHGDLWKSAQELGVSPWWLVAVVLLLGAAWRMFRIGLIDSA